MAKDPDPQPAPGDENVKAPEKQPKVETKEGKETIKIEKVEKLEKSELKDFKDRKEQKLEHKEHKSEAKDRKDFKPEHKEHKPESKEQKDFKDNKEGKDQKDQKLEGKEHKPENKEHKPEGKPEIKPEVKSEIKPEVKEKVEHLEGPVEPLGGPGLSAAAKNVAEGPALPKSVAGDKTLKLEVLEKQVGKEIKDYKDREITTEIFEIPGPGPIEQRLALLEQAVVEMSHFIQASQRPDLSGGALAGETDTGPAEGTPGGGEE